MVEVNSEEDAELLKRARILETLQGQLKQMPKLSSLEMAEFQRAGEQLAHLQAAPMASFFSQHCLPAHCTQI
jgi:hypothetical protein